MFRLYTIFELMDAILFGTMGTAEEDTIHLHAVTNNTAAAMRARGCQGMDGTFEAVEHMRLTVLAHLKTFVVFVAAYFTLAILPFSAAN